MHIITCPLEAVEDPISLSHVNHRTTVQEADEAVRAEMAHHAFGNTPNMIETFFGGDNVQDISTRIFGRLTDAGLYVRKPKRASRWTNLPISPSSESVIYEPLVEILNAITEECKADARFKIVWRDEHSKKPESHYSVDMKPDIVATFKYSGNDGSAPVWWRSMHALIEVKKMKDPLPAATQLLRYIRQALREQPDRRFMFGLVFSKSDLTLWHIDRSGALASTPFNVHKEPKRFIQIIVGLLTQSPEELGWDPTMQMYAEDNDGSPGHGIYSYEIDANATPIEGRGAYERMWLVTVDIGPAAADGTRQQVQFVLHRALGLSWAEVIRGRASRIWRAWDLGEMILPKDKRKNYVFKDSWRDERRRHEGELYAKAGACDGVAKVHCYGVVHMGSQRDDTLMTIRRNLEHYGDAIDLNTRQLKFTATEELEKDKYLMQSSRNWAEWVGDLFLLDTGNKYIPRNRIHTRVIMSTYGWPLTEFLSLRELLGALHDAVAGHQYLYEKGILHRDISSGNILVTGDCQPNRGVLVDMDYAIEYRVHETLQGDERSGTTAFMSYELLRKKTYGFETSRDDEDSDGDAEGIIDKEAPDSGIKHDAIHDLEAFFWVLCWICIAREGPGASRTTWSKVGNPDAISHIQDLAYQTFEQEDECKISACKKDLLAGLMEWKDFLFSLAPYFSPLIPCLRQLRRVLFAAYTSREFSSVHASFLRILSDAEALPSVRGWHLSNPEYQEMEVAVQQRREEDIAIWDSPKPERGSRAGNSRPETIPEEDEEEEEEPVKEDSSPSNRKRRTSMRVIEKNKLKRAAEAEVNAEAGPSTIRRTASMKTTRRKSERLGEADADAGSSSAPARKRKADASVAENKTKKPRRKRSL
ncbi:hypothetical protein DENSPDRAFT_826579 [Dentipellis sp. KUC8613]|nr:hypothetical protein DENSPDRAFT_826579 [Dentipellis sp. KUC8613]